MFEPVRESPSARALRKMIPLQEPVRESLAARAPPGGSWVGRRTRPRGGRSTKILFGQCPHFCPHKIFFWSMPALLPAHSRKYFLVNAKILFGQRPKANPKASLQAPTKNYFGPDQKLFWSMLALLVNQNTFWSIPALSPAQNTFWSIPAHSRTFMPAHCPHFWSTKIIFGQ